MTVTELIQGISKCECGREHICPIKHIIIKSDATKELPAICEDYEKILLVADENTYRAAGEAVYSAIGDKVYSSVIFDGSTVLVPDEAAIERIEARLCEGTDLIVGIGSGVINDLCKYVSFRASLPYYIVATAPSMDGYASVGAALILGGNGQNTRGADST